jgi:hypothetical protein
MRGCTGAPHVELPAFKQTWSWPQQAEPQTVPAQHAPLDVQEPAQHWPLQTESVRPQHVLFAATGPKQQVPLGRHAPWSQHWPPHVGFSQHWPDFDRFPAVQHVAAPPEVPHNCPGPHATS